MRVPAHWSDALSSSSVSGKALSINTVLYVKMFKVVVPQHTAHLTLGSPIDVPKELFQCPCGSQQYLRA